jgi:hypothetical protein
VPVTGSTACDDGWGARMMIIRRHATIVFTCLLVTGFLVTGATPASAHVPAENRTADGQITVTRGTDGRRSHRRGHRADDVARCGPLLHDESEGYLSERFRMRRGSLWDWILPFRVLLLRLLRV